MPGALSSCNPQLIIDKLLGAVAFNGKIRIFEESFNRCTEESK